MMKIGASLMVGCMKRGQRLNVFKFDVLIEFVVREREKERENPIVGGGGDTGGGVEKIDELPSWKIAVQNLTNYPAGKTQCKNRRITQWENRIAKINELPSWKIAVQKSTNYPVGKSQCKN